MDLGNLSRITDSAKRQYARVADSDQDKLAALKRIVEDLRDTRITSEQAASDIQNLIGGSWEPAGPSVKGTINDINVDCIFEYADDGRLPAIVAGKYGNSVDFDVELPDNGEEVLEQETLYDPYRDSFCKTDEDITAFDHSWGSSDPTEMFYVPGNFSEEENAVFIPAGHYFKVSGEFNEVEDLGTSDYAEASKAFMESFTSFDDDSSDDLYNDDYTDDSYDDNEDPSDDGHPWDDTPDW